MALHAGCGSELCELAGSVMSGGTEKVLGQTPRLSASGDVAAQSAINLLLKDQAPFISFLDLGGASLSLATVQSLANFLRLRNKTIVSLSLRRALIGDAGFACLLSGILKAGPDSPLRSLDLRANRLTKTSGKSLAAAFLDAESDGISRIDRIDLSNNNLTHAGLTAIEAAAAPRGKTERTLQLRAEGNLVLVEVLNGLTHGLGVVGSIIGGTMLVYRSSQILPLYQALSMALFALCLCTMFLSSCLYHSFFRIPGAAKVFHTADHCSIFVLIAGSYTPFVTCYTLDPPTFTGPVILFAVWLCAVLGVLMSVRVIPSTRSSRAYFALATGWIGVLPVKLMVSRMTISTILLVVCGGLAYTVGSVFYLLGKRQPFLHVVWHLAVMLGGGLHMVALWTYILEKSVA